MRFNLLLQSILIISAMLNEFPQALTFILIDNRYSFLLWSFYHRTILYVLKSFIIFRQCIQFIMGVEIDGFVILGKVHEAVCTYMIDQKFIIKINLISLFLVGTMGTNLPDHLRAWLRANFYCEGSIPRICSFKKTS